MNTFTEWFNKLLQQVGTNTAIVELIKLYETIPEDERGDDPVVALQKAFDTNCTLSFPQVLVKERLSVFNEIRQELQNRYNTIDTPMTLSEVSSKETIYDYVIGKLETFASDKPNKQLLHKYYFDTALSDEDGIYALTGAILASHMQQDKMAVALINLAGTLCMKIDKRFSLHYRTPTPCNCSYTELYETGKLLFNGFSKSSLIKIIDNLHNDLEELLNVHLTDYFSGTVHTICECTELAKQYARGAHVIDVRDFDALETINGGYLKLLYLIGIYAEGVDRENTLAFDIILTLAIQAVMLYGKKLTVNPCFFNEEPGALSYTDIARLLFTE